MEAWGTTEGEWEANMRHTIASIEKFHVPQRERQELLDLFIRYKNENVEKASSSSVIVPDLSGTRKEAHRRKGSLLVLRATATAPQSRVRPGQGDLTDHFSRRLWQVSRPRERRWVGTWKLNLNSAKSGRIVLQMGRPATLLEGLCGHALSLGAESIEVEYKDGREWVFAGGIGVASYPSSSTDGEELRGNLYAARKKPVRTVIGGQVYILKVRVFDSFGEDAFEVRIEPAPIPDPSVAPSITEKQGQYLAFIYNYAKIHRQAPSESDLERYFRVSPPSVHEMIKTLERNGLIERTPGKARSIRLLVAPEHLPRLG
jgi:LexA DNA binding domain